MLPQFRHSQELLEEVQRESLYGALLQQLDKDFARANIPIRLDKGVLPTQLGTLLQEKIYVLILERFPDYLNLLYMVDIPEQQVRAIGPSDAVELSAAVTFLLLKREAQKVWYKSRFSP